MSNEQQFASDNQTMMYIFNGDKETNMQNVRTLMNRLCIDKRDQEYIKNFENPPYDDMYDPAYETNPCGIKFNDDGTWTSTDDDNFDFRNADEVEAYKNMKNSEVLAGYIPTNDYMDFDITVVNDKNSKLSFEKYNPNWHRSNNYQGVTVIVDNAHDLDYDKLFDQSNALIKIRTNQLSSFPELSERYTKDVPTVWDDAYRRNLALTTGLMMNVPALRERFDYAIENGHFKENAWNDESVKEIYESAITGGALANAWFIQNLRPIPNYMNVLDLEHDEDSQQLLRAFDYAAEDHNFTDMQDEIKDPNLREVAKEGYDYANKIINNVERFKTISNAYAPKREEIKRRQKEFEHSNINKSTDNQIQNLKNQLADSLQFLSKQDKKDISNMMK